MRILALTTSYNRRESTLRSLHSLLLQNLPDGFCLDVCLVNDASTDGTGDAVRTRFPAVKVLDSPGNLYWAGGMRFGWEQYGASQDPDFVLAFNDDIELFPDALEVCLASARELEERGTSAYAIAGAFVHPDSNQVAYGGVRRSSWWHPLRYRPLTPRGELQECDTLNMNFALISRTAIERIGFLSTDFTHGKADFDFGLRLRAQGGSVVLTPSYVGRCSTNDLVGTSLPLDLPFAERWRRLTGLKEQPPRERAIYYRRHGGPFWFVFWLLPYIRVGLESLMRVVRLFRDWLRRLARSIVFNA